MKTIAILASLFSLQANAAVNYKQFYLVNGKQSEMSQALMAAINGQEVVKCQTVEAKVSKSGTSISMRNIKKPKLN